MEKIYNKPKFAFNEALAYRFGIPAALILNRIAWSINYHIDNQAERSHKDRFYFDGHWWMSNTAKRISEHFGGLISLSLVRKNIRMLEQEGVLVAKRAADKQWDQTKWYAIDRAVYDPIVLPSKLEYVAADVNGGMSEKVKESTPLEVNEIENLSLVKNLYHNHNHNQKYHENSAGFQKTDDKPAAPIPQDDLRGLLDFDLALGKSWLEFAEAEMKWKKAPESWNRITFAKAIAKLRKSVDLNDEGLTALFEFIKGDAFWSGNALSPAALFTKSKNGNRKIDNILLAMKNSNSSSSMLSRISDNMTESDWNYNPLGLGEDRD